MCQKRRKKRINYELFVLSLCYRFLRLTGFAAWSPWVGVTTSGMVCGAFTVDTRLRLFCVVDVAFEMLELLFDAVSKSSDFKLAKSMLRRALSFFSKFATSVSASNASFSR
jgi:hypothetical protein